MGRGWNQKHDWLLCACIYVLWQDKASDNAFEDGFRFSGILPIVPSTSLQSSQALLLVVECIFDHEDPSWLSLPVSTIGYLIDHRPAPPVRCCFHSATLRVPNYGFQPKKHNRTEVDRSLRLAASAEQPSLNQSICGIFALHCLRLPVCPWNFSFGSSVRLLGTRLLRIAFLSRRHFVSD
jgi:hypothetical protein